MLPERHWRTEPLLQLGVGLFIALCVGTFVSQGLGALVSAGDSLKGRPVIWSQVAGTLSFHGIVLGMVHWFLRCHETNWVEGFGLNAPGKAQALRLTLFGIAALLPIALALAKLSEMALQAAGLPTDAQASVRSLQATQTIVERAVFAFTALITAPLVEEILFRGILYPMLKSRIRPVLALWGSAFIFALIHVNLPTMVPLTVLAVGLTVLYETTGNLLAPALAHALFNTANFVLLLRELPN